MHIYIWDAVSPVSPNYHDDGAVVIIAADLDSARTLWLEHSKYLWEERYAGYTESEVRDALGSHPDHAYPLKGEHEPKVIVHEDAGCC